MRTDTGDNNDSDATMADYEDLWVLRFMNQRQNRYLERIQDFFIQDRFNLHGLKEKIEGFEDAYLAIQDKKPSRDFEREGIVYLLAHQRYIYTKVGADNVLDRVLNREYGICPRYGCKDISLVPIGLSNDVGKHGTMTYCHNCGNLFEPRGSLRKLDGCAWGNGFAHFLILSYPYHFEKKTAEPYIPRIFGFQIAKSEDNDSA